MQCLKVNYVLICCKITKAFKACCRMEILSSCMIHPQNKKRIHTSEMAKATSSCLHLPCAPSSRTARPAPEILQAFRGGSGRARRLCDTPAPRAPVLRPVAQTSAAQPCASAPAGRQHRARSGSLVPCGSGCPAPLCLAP